MCAWACETDGEGGSDRSCAIYTQCNLLEDKILGVNGSNTDGHSVIKIFITIKLWQRWTWISMHLCAAANWRL